MAYSNGCMSISSAHAVQGSITDNVLQNATFGSRLVNVEHQIMLLMKGSERMASEKIHGRLDDLDTSVQELGSHFLEYQADLAASLLKEFTRITQNMQHTEDKIMKHMQDIVVTSVGKMKDHITAETNTECERLWESIKAIQASDCSASSLTVSVKSDDGSRGSQQKGKTRGSTSPDSASTAGSVSTDTATPGSDSEDMDSPDDMRRLMRDMRKDVDQCKDVRGDLKTVEKLVLALETSIIVQQAEVKEMFYRQQIATCAATQSDNSDVSPQPSENMFPFLTSLINKFLPTEATENTQDRLLPLIRLVRESDRISAPDDIEAHSRMRSLDEHGTSARRSGSNVPTVSCSPPSSNVSRQGT